MDKACPWCGLIHQNTCWMVKVYEYFPNGTLKRVEFHGADPQPISVPSVSTSYVQHDPDIPYTLTHPQ